MTALTFGYRAIRRTVLAFPGTTLNIPIGVQSADLSVPTPEDMAATTFTAICRKESSTPDDQDDVFEFDVTVDDANAIVTLTASPDLTQAMETARYKASLYATSDTNRWLAAIYTLDAVRVPGELDR